MPSPSEKPLVFISYAHLDEPDPPEQPRWLSFVMEFLRPGVKGRKYEVWMDRLMPGGADWNPEIEAKIRACDIFVLLVSTRSTESDYILDNEIPIIRERQRNDDGVYFYPLLLDWTPKAGLEQVNDKNLRPRDAKPFSSLSASEHSRAMAEAADEIAEVAKAIEEWKTKAVAQAELFKEMTKLRHYTGPMVLRWTFGPDGRIVKNRTAARSVLVAISGLPETGYERLVGREEELTRLDEAWSDGKTNILSLIAEGGAGKSALVNEWLTRMQAGGYRNAERVLGWSFYSQGSKERATAADEFLNWGLTKLDVKIDTTSASAKGEAIAEALIASRVLLVLDGVEPLQHGPGPEAGQLKDQGLRALLRRFAAAPPRADHSLIVLTSRVAVADIKRFKDGAAPVVDVERLSDEAGAELLRDNDVWGIDRELRAAAHEFGGHPLALTLLASLIKETQNGDVRRRDHIRGLLADPDNPRHDQARRVMESYEKERLADQPALLAILHCVGLFDRPASADCLKALRAKPAIPGLTDALVDLSEDQWRRAVARLREVHLLAPIDLSDPDALDAHPLVREWFGEQLRLTNEAAWKEAHSRLYDHLRDTTHEGQAPTLADLAPLYHAIAHGCRAGRHQEALDDIMFRRICRVGPDGLPVDYSGMMLGAHSADLAALSWFFDKPYEIPAAEVLEVSHVFILGYAAQALRSVGRIEEALGPLRGGLLLSKASTKSNWEAGFMAEALGRSLEGGSPRPTWRDPAIGASNLSQTELLVGDVASAVATAERASLYAYLSGDALQKIINLATYGSALCAFGDVDKAEGKFRTAELAQGQLEPFDLLYSLRGYKYCDLLLSRGAADAVLDRAKAIVSFESATVPTPSIARHKVSIGRAHLLLALQGLVERRSEDRKSNDLGSARAAFDDAIDSLSSAGMLEFVANAHLARAAFRRAVGDWDGTKRDLDETKEIAEPGLMRLYWCDCALEGARLALARLEAFAPLNGLVEPSPPPPALPGATAAAALREEARKELDVARKLIAECGYHRRDEELAELDEVIAGGRRFADLPPRV